MRILSALSLVVFCGCAQLHHVAIGDIDNSTGQSKKRFDIKVSETGINLQEASQIAKLFLSRRGGREAENIAAIVGLFQMGPHTGNGVYVKDYAVDLVKAIYDKCPSGHVTGLTSVRESRKYPVVSGEIVKLTGYCLVAKEG